jgi:hypothetical protein
LAREFGRKRLSFYCTSLDFFQQALPGGNVDTLKALLSDIIELKLLHGVDLELRALTLADSYNAAMASPEVLALVREAGFVNFGFGADGAASPTLLRSIRKGTVTLRSDLLTAFQHAEANGFVPEILYVFGVRGDTRETLEATKELCVGLLDTFQTSVYRGFPAKDHIPGNANWTRQAWRSSAAYEALLSDPALFLNLGFECLANEISHPDEEERVVVNRYAVEMSHEAHSRGRVQSYLTIPIPASNATTQGPVLMDDATLGLLSDIVGRYAPQEASGLTREVLIGRRAVLNEMIPKDK